ncbi:MAG: hypothetical protein P8L23_03390 [Flavobacteriales bacterium]|nr:hypothetical protein [Flavobacteriales bacterium]
MIPKLWCTLITLIISVHITSQMHISTYLREDYVWDFAEEEWSKYSSQDDMTFFELNKDLTLVKHTTGNLTSAYIIKTNTKNEERNHFEFDVISDVGNKYTMIIDVFNEDKSLHNVRFMYDREEKTYLVRHTVKTVWFDEE